MMKNTDKIKCPHCGEDSIAKIRPRMDGWQSVGNEFYCMMCSAALGPVPEEDASPETTSKNTDRLAALFGGELEEDAPEILNTDPAERRFCRDCRFYIVHPFHSRCGKFDRDTDPMDDCPEFESKEK